MDWGVVRCLVIAGPGFAKEQFKAFLEAGESGGVRLAGWVAG